MQFNVMKKFAFEAQPLTNVMGQAAFYQKAFQMFLKAAEEDIS